MTFDKVRDIVVEQLGVEADEVALESTFIDDLGADSLDIVELIMAFEEEFNIEIETSKGEMCNIILPGTYSRKIFEPILKGFFSNIK